MNQERQTALNENPDLPLTADEITRGWHFCYDFDGLLVGPGMHEYTICSCPKPTDEKKEP